MQPCCDSVVVSTWCLPETSDLQQGLPSQVVLIQLKLIDPSLHSWRRGGRPRSPPVPPLQHPSVARVTPPGGQSRASTTRSVADKSVEVISFILTPSIFLLRSVLAQSGAAVAAAHLQLLQRDMPPAFPHTGRLRLCGQSLTWAACNLLAAPSQVPNKIAENAR